MQYSQSGNYTAIAGLIVSVLGHFGVNATIDTVLQVIGGAVALYGIIASIIAHRSLAIAAGIHPASEADKLNG